MPVLFSCAGKQEHYIEPRSEANLSGLRIVTLAGSYYDMELSPRKDISLLLCNTSSDCLQALITNKADVLVNDEIVFNSAIRKEVFEIDSADYDFPGMETSIRQFCIKYNITYKCETVFMAYQLMLKEVMHAYIPFTLRITHSEMSDATHLDKLGDRRTHHPRLQGEVVAVDANFIILATCGSAWSRPSGRSL